eukprot:3173586-Pleurochrysis_carterae.AAC.3
MLAAGPQDKCSQPVYGRERRVSLLINSLRIPQSRQFLSSFAEKSATHRQLDHSDHSPNL